MIRRVLTLALLAMGLAAVPLASPTSAAPSVPTGFKLIQYDAGMFEYDLTNFVTIPGTQTLLATGKSGRVTRVDVTGDGMDASDATATIIGNMPTYYQGDRGLLGLSLADDYASTHHVFMLWDYCQITDAAPAVASDDQNCIPDGGLPTGRLSRMTLVGPASAPTGIDFTSEVLLIDNLPSWSPTPGATCTDSHTVGSVVTAPDGTLFVGNGDGSGYCGALDPSALSAQDIFSPRGKIFHINPDGSPVATNPFIAAKINGQNNYPVRDEYWAQRVFAYGLRNPFRFTLDGSVLHLGDVGWNTTEEQDNVTSGENMGWPCLEGGTVTTLDNSPECNTNFTAPMLTWPHVEVGRPTQSAAIGGVMYTGTSYPTAYRGYWFGDYARGDLFVGDHSHAFGGLGQWGALTSIQSGIGGDIMVSDIGRPGTGPGQISRIHYVSDGNAIPIASLSGSPLTGLAPLVVTFFPAGGDPDGILRTWTMDFGDGSPPLSALNQPPATIAHSYLAPGSYRAVLTVADDQGATASALVTVNVGNSPPDLHVLQPLGFYHIGDPIHVVATANDPDGDAVSLQYQPVIHHCPSAGECHVHPQAFQTSPDFVYPSHGDDTPDYYLEIVVKAIDARGGVTQKSVNYLLEGQVSPPPIGPPVSPPVGSPEPPAVQGLRFDPQPPERIVDTRTEREGLRAQTPVAINLGGHSAAMLTATVTNPVAAGYLTVYPCGFNQGTSTVNYNAGQTTSNVTIVTVPSDGWVCFWSLHATDLVVDLSGYFDTTGLGYAPQNPVRLFDSRPNAFLGGHQVVLNVAEAPPEAEAMLVNLTVDQPTADGYLRAYPCAAESNTSNVNYAAGETISNFAAVQAPGGTVCFRSFASTQVIADLAGWFISEGGDNLTSVSPTRLFDTRSTAEFDRLQAGQEIRVALGLPPGTTAAVLNITAADPSVAGYVQVYPCGTDPRTSSVNYQPHQVAAANMTVVKVPTSGQVCFKSFAATDLIVDLSGWFS